jgi:hypothetical protein
MCNKDVRAVGDHFPIPPDCSAASDIESPIVEFGLNWRSPDLQTRHFRARVFEIDCTVEEFSSGSRMTLEHQIMISGDDNLVSMGLFAQPLIEINYLSRSIAERHEIAGMNQHVPIRHAQFAMLAVCIADA